MLLPKVWLSREKMLKDLTGHVRRIRLWRYVGNRLIKVNRLKRFNQSNRFNYHVTKTKKKTKKKNPLREHNESDNALDCLKKDTSVVNALQHKGIYFSDFPPFAEMVVSQIGNLAGGFFMSA